MHCFQCPLVSKGFEHTTSIALYPVSRVNTIHKFSEDKDHKRKMDCMKNWRIQATVHTHPSVLNFSHPVFLLLEDKRRVLDPGHFLFHRDTNNDDTMIKSARFYYVIYIYAIVGNNSLFEICLYMCIVCIYVVVLWFYGNFLYACNWLGSS